MINNKFFQIFLILTGFQITWIACVFGEFYNNSFIGVIIGIIYLIIYFFFIQNKINYIKFCFLFSLIGYSFDSLMAYKGYYYIKSDKILGYLPLWLIVLWPSFTTILYSVFNFLENKIILSFIIGIVIGPITYYSGIFLDISFSKNLFFYFMLLSIFWGLLLVFYSLSINYFKR